MNRRWRAYLLVAEPHFGETDVFPAYGDGFVHRQETPIGVRPGIPDGPTEVERLPHSGFDALQTKSASPE
jgi:hypothetical protein